MPFAFAAATKSSILATGAFFFGLSISFAGFFLFWLTLRGAGAARRGLPLQRTLLTLDASFLLLDGSGTGLN